MSTVLYDPVKTQQRVARDVLVGFSGGKDSIVTLDLCARFFDRVQPFFMYYIPGMEFQENIIRKYEKRYGVQCIRIPHFETSDFFRYGTFREPDYHVPIVSVSDVYAYLRQKTGIHWIACGERISDSIVRRAMLKHSGSIDLQRGRFYPICYWTKRDIMDYIRQKKLLLPNEYGEIGHSFRSLAGSDVLYVKKRHPSDYKKLLRLYPMAEATAYREEFLVRGEKNEIEVSNV